MRKSRRNPDRKPPKAEAPRPGKPAKPARTSTQERGPRSRGTRPRPARTLATAGREIGRRLGVTELKRVIKPGLGRVVRLLSLVLRWSIYVVLIGAVMVERLIRRALGLISPRLSAAVDWLGRNVTPPRALALVAAAAGLAAIASQFLDYRGVAIGPSEYAEVAALTSAPMAETYTPWHAHGPLILLAALLGCVAVLIALRPSTPPATARRATVGGLVASGAGLAVILGLDLPKADEVGELAAQYAGVEPVLFGAFYVQLSAMVLLLFAAGRIRMNRKVD